MQTKTYTVVAFYMDDHSTVQQRVQADSPGEAASAFVDPRGDQIAYDMVAIIEGAPAVYGPRPSPEGDELRKAYEHASSCSGTLQPPAIEGSRLWICDECSTAIEQ